jgi:hypothetical protein
MRDGPESRDNIYLIIMYGLPTWAYPEGGKAQPILINSANHFDIIEVIGPLQ